MLLTALTDQSSSIRASGASALGSLGNEKAITPLIICLKDYDAYVRASAAEALGRIGSVQTVESLIVAINDQDPYVRICVVEALGHIKDSQALPALEIVAQNDIGEAAWFGTVKDAATAAINEIKKWQQQQT